MPSILLVDDDEVFRDAVSRALRAAGYAVEVAENGQQAFKTLQAEAPDLVITDILMPGGDGVELTSAIRRDYPALPIVVMSGRPQVRGVDLLEVAMGIGANGALRKPLSTEELLAVTADVLAASKAG